MADDGDIAVLEDKLLGREDCESDVVTNYCEQFFKENRAYTFPPFIDSATETELNVKPEWYDEHLSALVANYEVEELPDRASEEAAEREEVSELGLPADALSSAQRRSSKATDLEAEEMLSFLESSGPSVLRFNRSGKWKLVKVAPKKPSA